MVKEIVALCVGFAGLAGGGQSAPGQQPGQGGIFSLAEKVVERTFDVADGGNLRIDFPEIEFANADGVIETDIEIRTGAGEVVIVEIWLASGRMDWARRIVGSITPRATWDGATVTIQPGSDLLPFEQPTWAHRLTLFIRVSLPERFNVSVRAHNGKVYLERLRGNATLELQRGDVRVGQVQGPAVVISTGTGSIFIEQVDAGDGLVTAARGGVDIGSLRGQMYAAATGGNIRIARAERAAVTLKSVDGNVSLGLLEMGRTTVVSEGGDISIHGPATLPATVYIEGTEVHLDGAFAFEGIRSATRIEGRINGGGERLEAMSSDGGVRLTSGPPGPKIADR